MGQFEGDDHRETKDVVFAEIVVCLIQAKGRERGKEREDWADFRISASRFTCQVIQSASERESEYFKCPLGAL